MLPAAETLSYCMAQQEPCRVQTQQLCRCNRSCQCIRATASAQVAHHHRVEAICNRQKIRAECSVRAPRRVREGRELSRPQKSPEQLVSYSGPSSGLRRRKDRMPLLQQVMCQRFALSLRVLFQGLRTTNDALRGLGAKC